MLWDIFKWGNMIMDYTVIGSLLQKFYLFKELNNEHLEQVAKESIYQFARRWEIIFSPGDSALGLFLLLEGQVKLAVTSPQGTEKVIGIIEEGESFGEAVIFMDRPFFPISAVSTKDSKLLLIPKRVIFELLEQDKTVARKMLAGLSLRNHQLIQEIETIALYTSSRRLVDYLLQIAESSGNSNSITLPTSKMNIASLLNITPETLSRTMFKLQQSGLIEVDGKEISILDIPGLRSFAFQA